MSVVLISGNIVSVVLSSGNIGSVVLSSGNFGSGFGSDESVCEIVKS